MVSAVPGPRARLCRTQSDVWHGQAALWQARRQSLAGHGQGAQSGFKRCHGSAADVRELSEWQGGEADTDLGGRVERSTVESYVGRTSSPSLTWSNNNNWIFHVFFFGVFFVPFFAFAFVCDFSRQTSMCSTTKSFGKPRTLRKSTIDTSSNRFSISAMNASRTAPASPLQPDQHLRVRPAQPPTQLHKLDRIRLNTRLVIVVRHVTRDDQIRVRLARPSRACPRSSRSDDRRARGDPCPHPHSSSITSKTSPANPFASAFS